MSRRGVIAGLLVVVLSAWVGLANGLPGQGQAAYSFAVVPQFRPERSLQDWTPVFNEIRRRTGIQLTWKPYANIPVFEQGFLAGEPDFAYLNPYHAVMARRAQGYRPLVRDDAKRLTGILVVRKDSPVTSIEQLQNADIGFPAPNAFGASLYMRALLSQAGLQYTPHYVFTHANVYRHVLSKSTDAGGGVRHTLNRESEGIRRQLRILYETPPSPPHPVVAHPRVPEAVQQAVQQAFVEIGQDPAFAPILANIQVLKPHPASYTEYQPLEALGLERFVETEAVQP
jgi:phosphonate transport system substrate-binding protein